MTEWSPPISPHLPKASKSELADARGAQSLSSVNLLRHMDQSLTGPSQFMGLLFHGFPKQEDWERPFPPEDLSNPGIRPTAPHRASWVTELPSEVPRTQWEVIKTQLQAHFLRTQRGWPGWYLSFEEWQTQEQALLGFLCGCGTFAYTGGNEMDCTGPASSQITAC